VASWRDHRIEGGRCNTLVRDEGAGPAAVHESPRLLGSLSGVFGRSFRGTGERGRIPASVAQEKNARASLRTFDGLVREEPLSLLLAFPLGSHEGLEMETVRAQNVDRDVGRVPQYC